MRQNEKSILANEKNSRETWSAIKAISGCDTKNNYAEYLISENPTDSVERANYYFSTLGRNLADKILANGAKPANVNTMPWSLNSFVLDSPDESIDTCLCPNMTKSKSIKYLGVIIDEKLSWLPHIDLISSCTRILIWTFKRLRHIADFDLLKTVYYALAQSIIGYCIVAWGGASVANLATLSLEMTTFA
ncbi:unnamed protein product [Parnassius mnemosyne]|uniref:Reverse transcriptase n=1 Tax=Parnassius mnemosyne TaxID=213953 RepID=A0AAV1KUL1_9NEOP